jgi:dCTP deaminase
MSFWSRTKIIQHLSELFPTEAVDEINVESNAYELALGNEVFITTEHKKTILKDGEQIVIPPGQFALLITKEYIKIPKDVMGFISIKARIKFRGLVNVSGFHVDPGFEGKLKFSVFNAASQNIILEPGMRIFPIWFADLDQETDRKGSHHKQKHIDVADVMSLQGEVASPASLNQRLYALERTVAIGKWIVVTAAAAFLVRTIQGLPQKQVENPQKKPTAISSTKEATVSAPVNKPVREHE